MSSQLLSFFGLMSLLCFMHKTQAQRIYVDQTSTASMPDGSSWALAYPDLQDGIDAATAGDSIWIAIGTYLPTKDSTGNASPSDNRQKTFYLDTDNLKLFGGFTGTETAFSQRDIAANPTILSGDIGTSGDNTDNAYHVMYLDGTTNGPISPDTELDGVTLREGNANGFLFPNGVGGGMYLNGSGTGNEASPTLTQCTFSQNQADIGGAMYNDGFSSGTSSPSLTNCTFSQNQANFVGGAMCNGNSGNGTSSPSLTSCTFSQNQAIIGGAMYNDSFGSTSSPSLTSCTFSQNQATDGGAMFNNGSSFGTSSPSLTNCTFSQNQATSGGGAMYNGSIGNGTSSPSLTNCTFSQNQANRNGGAIYNRSISNGTSSPRLANCILWKNRVGTDQESYGAQIAESSGSQSLITYSLVNGIDTLSNKPALWTNNIASDPLFVDAAGGDLRLQVASPAIDAGINGSIPAGISTDLAGNARIQGMSVDMGAFEGGIIVLTRIYVDESSTVAMPDGSSWAMAYPDLQDGIDAASAGDSIWIAAGTYLPTKDITGNASPINNRSKTFYLNTDNIKLFGGFAGTETTFSQRDVTTNSTTLSGDLGTTGDNTDNAYHVMYLDGTTINGIITSDTELDGITLTGGNADGGGGQNRSGGGIYLDGERNEASPILTHCTFSQNQADFGGAMFNNGYLSGTSSPSLTNCTFSQNQAEFGGAMHNSGVLDGTSSPSLTNCTFSQNQAGSGGAMYNSGVVDGTSSPTLTNCTFLQNQATSGGGAMSNEGRVNGVSSPILANCILWENKADTDSTSYSAQISENNDSQSLINYSLVNGIDTLSNKPTSWTNNLASDPLFVDAAGGDLRLEVGSPAIDAGINDSIPAGITTDLAGNTRIQGISVDMGAFEGGVPVAIDPETTPLAILKAYPNPVRTQLTLEWEVLPERLRGDEVFTAQLYDLQGRNLKTYFLLTNQIRHTLDLKDLPTGLYTLQLAGWSVKVVKR
ncbi:MAG: choice-of-anchor Q domain-containing protein [Bacteroidota bacterium]